MERKLKHPKHGIRIVCREVEVVTIYAEDLTQLDEQVFATELTAKAFEHYLLLMHADLGFKPTS